MTIESKPSDVIDQVLADWRNARPETKADALQVVGRILWLGRRYEDDVVRLLSERGLAYSDYDVLATLRRAGIPYELAPTDLARRVLLSSGGLTACLRRLETWGYVSRHSVPNDRRRLMAKLTPKGFDLVESFIDQRFNLANQALNSLRTADIEQAETLLRQLMRATEATRNVDDFDQHTDAGG